ncbi:MAG: Nif3-like dinuclear metal center hexameric protein [Saprospiraceae bacterium]
MTIRALTSYLETIAPPMYQEEYDNAGLIVGDPNADLKGVLLCLDSTEAIVDEAIAKNCNLIVAHHPIVFRGLKKITGKNYVERTILNAIKNDIAIYAIHTNLDNVYQQGVNAKICQKLGLEYTQILSPKKALKQYAITVPAEQAKIVRNLMLTAGLAEVNATNAIDYTADGSEEQVRLSAVALGNLEGKIRLALEKVDGLLEINALETPSKDLGAGMIGYLPQPMAELDFLQHVKQTMRAGVVRHTALRGREVRIVAVCGGSGSFLLGGAIAQGADVLVTADFKYHEFFDADGKIIIADIGHFESEQFTIELLHEIISKKFSNFALHCTEVSTNPIAYL